MDRKELIIEELERCKRELEVNVPGTKEYKFIQEAMLPWADQLNAIDKIEIEKTDKEERRIIDKERNDEQMTLERDKAEYEAHHRDEERRIEEEKNKIDGQANLMKSGMTVGKAAVELGKVLLTVGGSVASAVICGKLYDKFQTRALTFEKEGFIMTSPTTRSLRCENIIPKVR